MNFSHFQLQGSPINRKIKKVKLCPKLPKEDNIRYKSWENNQAMNTNLKQFNEDLEA